MLNKYKNEAYITKSRASRRGETLFFFNVLVIQIESFVNHCFSCIKVWKIHKKGVFNHLSPELVKIVSFNLGLLRRSKMCSPIE